MKNLQEIGKIIKERRILLRILQTDISEISGVSLRSYKDIENGKGNPTLIQLYKIINSLGLKIEIKPGKV